jgi:hypothetical protein
LLNWSDPPVTLVFTALLALPTACVSLVLALVPPPTLAFVAGLVALTPALLDAAGLRKRVPPAPAAAPAVVAAAAAAGTSATEAAPPAADVGAVDDAPAARTAAAPRCLQMAQRVLARVPDGRDLAHRHFALSEQLLELEDLDEPPLDEEGERGEGAGGRTDGYQKLW